MVEVRGTRSLLARVKTWKVRSGISELYKFKHLKYSDSATQMAGKHPHTSADLTKIFRRNSEALNHHAGGETASVHTPGRWRLEEATSFSIRVPPLPVRCRTRAYEWAGGRHLVVIHHCVEWFDPHRINVSVQHNPLRPSVGDIGLLPHQRGKQTWHSDSRGQKSEIARKKRHY